MTRTASGTPKPAAIRSGTLSVMFRFPLLTQHTGPQGDPLDLRRRQGPRP
jgi:hypothetical protein